MPIKPLAGVLNAVFLVRAGGPWTERLRTALLELSRGRPGRDQRERPDTLKVAMHLDVIEQRLAGELDWERELGRGLVERGGVSPAGRNYTDMVEVGGRLPRYAWAPLFVTADLFNPRNEAEEVAWDDTLEAIELSTHTLQLYPWARGTLADGTPINVSDPSCYAKMGRYGEAFGELIARWCELLEPVFAFADLKNSAPFLTRATAAAGPEHARGVRYWDHLWPISCWSPALLAERPGLAERLQSLALKPEELARVDPFERTGLKGTIRRLSNGGLFVQYRTILGGERQGSRATVDGPLADRAGLKKLF